ncbi:hypothetical protein HYH03_000060 [Edaphochlamys debaryana]|uniref:Guanylate cyclase domain-containing protein n=1 Tax=Edaphochlamys debaryana TaxID=47281 RepID=A0A836C6V1_9CHLO|nr:hypothetical protein HYH03_000060 [Edaphochlamys debaryana]|eukprot:KAG2501553.1 hypothetical protein HYH03_000060 [Edaphochlamys debaryana]
MRSLGALAFVGVFALALASQAVAQDTSGTGTSSDNKLLCMAEMVSNIETSCSKPDIQGYYVALESLLKDYLRKCFHTNFSSNRALHTMLPDLGDGATEYFKGLSEGFKDMELIEVVPTFVPAAQINSEIEFELEHNLTNSHDGWILDPMGMGSIFNFDGFQDLTQVVNVDPARPDNASLDVINWKDVHPYFQNTSTYYDSTLRKFVVVTLPLDGNIKLLYYRRDVFAKYKLSVPRTWEEVLEVGAALKALALDENGDGAPDFAFCMDRRKDCHQGYFDIISIVAPYLQYNGSSQGVVFEPTTIHQADKNPALVDNVAMAKALGIYSRLLALAPGDLAVDEKCDVVGTAPADSGRLMAQRFANGSCLMGVALGDFFKAFNASAYRGQLGVALMPGSFEVLNRTSNTLVPCTAELCPFATPIAEPAPAGSTPSTAPASSGSGTPAPGAADPSASPSASPSPSPSLTPSGTPVTQSGVSADGTGSPPAVASAAPNTVTRYLNRAPFAAGGGWVAAVNARTPNDYRNYSISFFAYLANPEQSWKRLLMADSSFDPYRLEHFANLSRWGAAGFHPNDTAAYLARAEESFSHPNIVLDLRTPGTKTFRDIYESGLANLTSGSDVDSVVSLMNTSFAKLLLDPQQKQFRSLLADTYLATINYNSIHNLNGTNSGEGSGGSGSPSWLPIAIVLPTVGALLLIAAGVVYEVRNNRKHKNLFGKVVPPGVGPDTTILVSEIQDYAVLAETLSAEVVDRLLKEHHDCLRRLLLRHSGYEGSCEGDSFVLAFHSPKDALLFAMETQAALLQCAWPDELLAIGSCGQLYVQGIMSTAKPKALDDILDASDEPITPAGASKIKALTPGLGAHMLLGDHHHGHGSHGHGSHGHFGSSGATLPSLVNVPATETYTFSNACRRAWKEASKEDTNKVLIFRGPRVRMGLHAGVHSEHDIAHSKADGRTTYSGDTVVMARAVAQAAQGGTVLLSEETYKKLPLERLWDKYLVLHMGEHRLRDTLPNLNLYHALNRTLEGRLAYVGPMTSLLQVDPGVLDAPVGCVTVAFMNVVGAQTLLSWNADVAQQAIKIFHTVVGDELKRRRGYLVEAVDGLFLAAFQRPSDAILWALECNEAMIKQDWPEDLLAHELCEELVISAPTKEGEVINTVVFRGLRLKTGVDTGQVLGEVHAMTGRMTYRGKVMNRAARIASTASTGQVLCSSDSWQLAMTADAQVMLANKVSGTSLGQFRLKGVAEKIEIHHCRKVSNVAPARRASSLVMSMADHWKWEQHLNAHDGGLGLGGGMVGPGGPNGNGNGVGAVGPEDILLGGDSIRGNMLSPRSFTRGTGSFRQRQGSDPNLDAANAAHLGIELAPDEA